MRKCNPRLAQFRQRRKALLPEIKRLAQLGLTCREIAAKMNLPKTTVHYYMQKLPLELPDSEPADSPNSPDKLDKLARNSPQRYELIFQRAMRAWDSSLAKKQIRVVERAADTDAKGGKTEKRKELRRSETHAGKSSFLASTLQAVKAIDRLKEVRTRRREDGVNADVQTIPISALSVDDFRSLTNEQLDALEARLVVKYGKRSKSLDSPPEPLKPE